MRARRFVQRYPVARFFILAVVWSYLYWQILFSLLPMDPAKGPATLQMALAALGGSPSLFGILLAYLSGEPWFLHLLSAWGLLGMPAFSILMAWLHARARQSLLLMLMFHFGLTSSFFFFDTPAAYPPADEIRFTHVPR